MKKVLIVGGAKGIGLSIAHTLAKRDDTDTIYILDKSPILHLNLHPKFKPQIFDLENSDYSIFNAYDDINTLIITAGFGKLGLFSDLDEKYIKSSFNVNTIAPIRIVRKFYDKINSQKDFYCGIMVSIAGFMSSPFFSVYAATKAALKIFIESVNVELEKSNTTNRILNVSPGSIKGTSFNNGETDLSLTETLSAQIIEHLFSKIDLFIPEYNKTYKEVLERYNKDFREEGRHSYDYKIASKRVIINK